MNWLVLAIVLLPLSASIVAGFMALCPPEPSSARKTNSIVHGITITGIALSLLLSVIVYSRVFNGMIINETQYIWAVSGGIPFQIGFLIDQLSVTMMVIVNFVSLMVHIYTIGYMRHDPGYQRFFCYISAFTFAMLILVMSNNFLQLFFGWEAVGLMSYLLIGFWYEKDTAILANMKAFIVNRVGDFGFLLGIAGVLYIFNSLDYAVVFAGVERISTTAIAQTPFGDMQWITIICLLLFVGAMGKSAQIPLHVWLPDSMEGPTPISALIHAATMVTAGIFMVARMSPLFEYSEIALTVVLIVGATTAILMALVALVQNDIKRVVAYSTLSQLGYMTVALGVSAYEIAVFHLTTHAFFKALLFLGAGSVIIAMQHQQDMRKMGGLRTIMPITYITTAIGCLALSGIPPFAGYFSKDSIIQAVRTSEIWGAQYAYIAVLLGVFVTAFYTFRMLFMTFHGNNRSDQHTRQRLSESPRVITWVLTALAVPSAIAGFLLLTPILTGAYFGDSIFILEKHDVVAALYADLSGGVTADFLPTTPIAPQHTTATHLSITAIMHGILPTNLTPTNLTQTNTFPHAILPFWLALAGIVFAWYCYIKNPALPGKIANATAPLHRILINKYGFDDYYQRAFTIRTRTIAQWLNKNIDTRLIDQLIVNGIAKSIAQFSTYARQIQTGLTNHYAFAMIIGLFILITAFVYLAAKTTPTT